VQLGTLEEIETFHMFLMRDLYREERPINFEMAYAQGREIDKKYYIVPIRVEGEGPTSRYFIDRGLMNYVVQIHKKGYRALQQRVTQEIQSIESQQEKEDYLKKYMLVNVMSNQEKKHRCYHYLQMIDNL
jgi:hypothetical protein